MNRPGSADASQVAFEAPRVSAFELPVTVVTYPHWVIDYEDAAKSASLALGLDDAVALVNAWLRDIGKRPFSDLES